MTLGIIVALPEELSTLTSQKIAKGCCVFITDTIVVGYFGAGAGNANAAAEHLITQGATRLLSWGCAAALSSALKPGDLVLADRLIDAEGAIISIASDWHRDVQQRLSNSRPVHTGSLAESHSIVASAKDKQHLHRQTGAIALDMESVAVAKVAQQHQLPFLAIRAIADPVDMDLPKAISYAFNEQGDIVLTRLLRFIAGHPLEVPCLIKLGLHFNAAKNTLKWVAKQLAYLSALPTPAP